MLVELKVGGSGYPDSSLPDKLHVLVELPRHFTACWESRNACSFVLVELEVGGYVGQAQTEKNYMYMHM